MSSRYERAIYVHYGDGAAGTTGFWRVPRRVPGGAYSAGMVVRPAVDQNTSYEFPYMCITSGVVTGAADATWNTSFFSTTNDGTVTWLAIQAGIAGLNNDFGNTLSWAEARAVDPSPQVGAIIKRNNGGSLQIALNTATMGATEPLTFSDIPGVRTGDGGVTWMSLGPPNTYANGACPQGRFDPLWSNWIAGRQGIILFVAHDNIENLGSFSAYLGGGPSTDWDWLRVISHNRLGNYPPREEDLIPGATFVGGYWNIIFRGSSYMQGLNIIGNTSGGTWTIGSAASSAKSYMVFKDCTLQNVNTSGAGGFQMGGGANPPNYIQYIVFDNTRVFFGNAGRSFMFLANFLWKNTQGSAFMPGSIPPTVGLFQGAFGIGTVHSIVLDGLDLTNLTGYLYAQNSTGIQGSLLLKDCRLNPFMTVANKSTWTQPGMTVQLARCSDTSYWHTSTREAWEGSDRTENLITRVGGCADPTGVRYSRKIVTNANPTWWRPFKCEPVGTWNLRTGSPIVVTIHGNINATSLPNNDDIWTEFEYLNLASTPQGAITRTTKLNILSAGVPIPADDLFYWSNGQTAEMAWEPGAETGVSISNQKLTAQNTGSTSLDQGTRGGQSLGQNTGKFYFECTLNVLAGGGSNGIGIGTTASTYTGMGTNANSGAMLFWSTGNIYANAANTGISLGARVANDVIGIATDFINRKIWFRKVNGTPGNWNNNVAANPETNVGGINLPPGGPFIPFCTFGGTAGVAGNRITMNCGQNVFTLLSRPAGFGNWFSYWLPFKMQATITPMMPGYIHARVRVGKPNATYYVDPKIEISV